MDQNRRPARKRVSRFGGGLAAAFRVGIAGLAAGSAALFAQPGVPDSGEVSAYGGVAFPTFGAHAAVGGSTGAAFSRYAIALIDTCYMPMGNYTLAYHPLVATASSGLFDFNLAIHIRIPVRERWAPYGLAAPALLYNTFQIESIEAGGAVRRFGQNDAKFGFETGGGLRYYVAGNWGIRGEYRYTFSTQNFSRLLAGIFYQFDTPWPFRSPSRGRRGRGTPY